MGANHKRARKKHQTKCQKMDQLDFASDLSPKLLSVLEEPTTFSEDGVYNLKFGENVHRDGKVFSYTFWRTQIEEEIFWSVQGVDNSGAKPTWVVTKYFGPPEQGRRFQQEVTLRHPTERKIKITYRSTCSEGENRLDISRCVINQFKNEDNTFKFAFRIVKLKRKPYPVRMA